jgi:hypothetical protein
MRQLVFVCLLSACSSSSSMRDAFVGKWFLSGSDNGSCDNGTPVNGTFMGSSMSLSLYGGGAPDQLYWDSQKCSLRVSGNTATPGNCELPSLNLSNSNGTSSSYTQTLQSLELTLSSGMLTMSESKQSIAMNYTNGNLSSTVTCSHMVSAIGTLDRTDLGSAPATSGP